VRRVKRLNPATVPHGQGELFTTWRHHAVFTDTTLAMLQAQDIHRGHAIIEQVHADLRAGPLAHLPSGSFAANSAWPVLAATASNLTRAAGAIASMFHAKATTATIRRQPIAVPARPARSARRLSCTYRRTGPGRTPGRQCSPPPAGHQAQRRPDHQPQRARPEKNINGRAGQTGRPENAGPWIQAEEL